ncbi:PEP-CTERM sorting domain-containing protein [Thalassotalea eurytherma]|uniref:Ice-binding protein C-terminal domain-containing protein n=1 Tax=Thalassotalea eurytherma TaxID=1144278 RepID=A0ABQ6HA87_9GAMM|nr:PEP-CTERM sorting domain-containing protein [Thalassotalea eurytherma]GLX83680.1 hypothetical protein theurythT_31330 [Thalassotalea eurytherma]
MKNKFLKGLIASIVLAVSGFANAGLIDFTTLGNEGFVWGDILPQDYFAEDGVIITGVDGDIVQLPCGLCLSASNSLNDFQGQLWIEFIDYSSSLNSTVQNIRFSTINDMTFTFFDDAGNVLGADNMLNSTVTEFYSFSSGISKVLVDFDYAGIFYIEFNGFAPDSVSVPEPSTIAVFALGLLGLASRKFTKQA